MRTIVDLARAIALFGLLAITVSACGSATSPAATQTVSGPALLFFYTDN